jgi:hypothetical protein
MAVSVDLAIDDRDTPEATKFDVDSQQTDGWRQASVGRRWLPGAVCVGLYIVMAMLVFGHFGSLGSGHMAGIGSMDSIEQIWWLGWAASAFPNVHSLLVSPGQNYPFGQNFGINGSMLALGIVLLPVTKWFGVVTIWNIIVRLAIAASASSMCFVLRRWTSWWPAAFVGGLLYGYSAYALNHGSYLFLNFVPLPPLIFLLLDEVLRRQHLRPRTSGVLLGLAFVVQFFISTEIFAGTAVIGAIATALYLLVGRRALIDHWRYSVTALSYGLGIAGVLLLVPLWITFAGPQHITGPPFSPSVLSLAPGDLLSAIVPTSQWVKPGPLALAGFTFTNGAILYLGIPMIVTLTCFAAFLRSRSVILFAGAMALISFVLSLGGRLHVDGHATGMPLPFAVFTHISAISGFVPTRFALYTALFASGMFAIGIDELWRRMQRSEHSGGHWPWRVGAVRAVVVGAITAAVVIPLVPAHTQPTVPTNVPTFFTSKAIRRIPSGSVVLAYPYPDLVGTNPYSIFEPTHSIMLDQAVARMRFDIIGGYGWFPPPHGDFGTTAPAQLLPRSVQALFDTALSVHATAADKALLSRSNLTLDLRSYLRRYNVDTVIVIHLGGYEPVTNRVTAAIGAPLESGGVTAWFDVKHRLATLEK